MNQQFCRGCGSVIQTSNPNAAGYVPETILEQKGQLVCKRCYRITHYGEVGAVQPHSDQIARSIEKAVAESSLLVIVADLADLAGTVPIWRTVIGEKPYILLVNKSDLLPARSKMLEVKDYLTRYLTTRNFPIPRNILLASGLRGGGVEVLANQIKAETAPDSSIAFLGATNVGKSSLIKKLLVTENSSIAPTVSKFPGTTLGLSKWSILKGRNILVDTPGLVPGNRLGDQLCPECASRLVSTAKIGEKLWGLKPGKGLILGGWFGVEPLNTVTEVVMIAFTSPEVVTHRTDTTKMEALLQQNPEWLNHACGNCRQKLTWDQDTIELPPNFDLAIAGLGWVSLRAQEKIQMKLRIPQEIYWEVRPALFGKR